MVVLMTLLLAIYNDNEVIHDHNNNSETEEYAGIRSSYKLFILHKMLQVRYSFYGKKRPETQIIRIIIHSYKSDMDGTPLDKDAILFYTRTCICIYPSHIRTVGFLTGEFSIDHFHCHETKKYWKPSSGGSQENEML